MLWLKSCPRCNGDLYKGVDIYGSYIACLQCSHYLTEAEEALRYAAGHSATMRMKREKTSATPVPVGSV
jgi:hypothetical protein